MTDISLLILGSMFLYALAAFQIGFLIAEGRCKRANEKLKEKRNV